MLLKRSCLVWCESLLDHIHHLRVVLHIERCTLCLALLGICLCLLDFCLKNLQAQSVNVVLAWRLRLSCQ